MSLFFGFIPDVVRVHWWFLLWCNNGTTPYKQRLEFCRYHNQRQASGVIAATIKSPSGFRSRSDPQAVI